MQTPGEQAFAQHSAQHLGAHQIPREERKETIELAYFLPRAVIRAFRRQSYRRPRFTDAETEAERFKHLPKVAQQGMEPRSEFKTELFTIRRHRLLQWESPELPAGLTSTTHTPYQGPTNPEPLITAVGSPTPRPRPRSPHASEGQPPLPARGPAPGRTERAPPAQPARAGSRPRPSPTRPDGHRCGERPRHRPQTPRAPVRPEAHPAVPRPPPRAH